MVMDLLNTQNLRRSDTIFSALNKFHVYLLLPTNRLLWKKNKTFLYFVPVDAEHSYEAEQHGY